MAESEDLKRRLARLKEQLAAYEAGRMQKQDARGHDITRYEIQDLKNKISGLESAIDGKD